MNINSELKYYYDYLKDNGRLSEYEVGSELIKSGKPVQYVIGNVNFYGNEIKVDENVLIPRFETEGLIEKTLKLLKNRSNLSILDLGTGSGCIAITLKKKLDCLVDAVDISDKALEVAKSNAELNNVSINFFLGDMYFLDKKYDLIISNPPYLTKEDNVMDIVKNNEPNIALYAENNGLYFYEKILKNCSNYLKSDYLIAFETGINHSEEIKKIAHKYLSNVEVIIEKDLYGDNRYLFIRNV